MLDIWKNSRQRASLPSASGAVLTACRLFNGGGSCFFDLGYQYQPGLHYRIRNRSQADPGPGDHRDLWDIMIEQFFERLCDHYRLVCRDLQVRDALFDRPEIERDFDRLADHLNIDFGRLLLGFFARPAGQPLCRRFVAELPIELFLEFKNLTPRRRIRRNGRGRFRRRCLCLGNFASRPDI